MDLVGKVMIAYTAIMVHHRFWKEHTIDAKVFREMKREQIVGVIGVVLMLIGYLIKLVYHFD